MLLAVFFAGDGVDDLVVFHVIRGVGAEGQFHTEQLFHAHEEVGVLAAETFEDAGVDHDAEGILLAVVAAGEAADEGAEAALQLDRHGRGALHDAAAAAIRAVGVEVGRQALLLALAGHLEDAELADGEDVVLGFVGGHGLDHLVVNAVAVAAFLHVDEVDDDEAAQIAQSDLAGGFDGGFEVDGVDDVFLLAAAVFVGAGVYVDGDQGLGFVDDDLTAGGELDLALEGLLDLALDVVTLEDRDEVGILFDAATLRRFKLAKEWGAYSPFPGLFFARRRLYACFIAVAPIGQCPRLSRMTGLWHECEWSASY